jgi:3-oxoacyl-[acyl-carrier-protein] synthase II
LEHAKKRNANILCEIKGYGMSSDAFHYTLPDPSGEGAYMAMLNCINDAKISLETIDYINAHGTSTPAGDKVEVLAIEKIFKNASKSINVSSTKSQIGHLLGAAGAVESIYSIKSIIENTLPCTINLDNPISVSNINFIKNEPMEINVNNVLSNSFGFGGTNVSLIFSKFNG